MIRLWLALLAWGASLPAMEASPESSRISQGSLLQKRRADEFINDISPSASMIAKKIATRNAQLANDPEFQEVIKRTELNLEQVNHFYYLVDKKFEKLKTKHKSQIQQYNSIATLFRKIMMTGLGLQTGYWIGAFKDNAEREWFGASVGITCVGALGYCYSKYQQWCMANNGPTRSDALNLVNKKDAQTATQK